MTQNRNCPNCDGHNVYGNGTDATEMACPDCGMQYDPRDFPEDAEVDEEEAQAEAASALPQLCECGALFQDCQDCKVEYRLKIAENSGSQPPITLRPRLQIDDLAHWQDKIEKLLPGCRAIATIIKEGE